MDAHTGEIILDVPFNPAPMDPRVIVKIPSKHHLAARKCAELKLPGWESANKEFNKWAKNERRKAKARRQQRTKSKIRNK